MISPDATPTPSHNISPLTPSESPQPEPPTNLNKSSSPPTAPKSRRPTRVAKTTPKANGYAELSDEDEMDFEYQSPSENSSASKPARRRVISAKESARLAAASAKRWAPENVLQSARSPLIDVDIKKILSNPAAWDALTPDQQTQIMGLLPDESRGSHIQRSTDGNGGTRIKTEFLKYDVDFSHAIANVQDDLRNHSYTPKAMRDAINASAERKLFNTKEPCENEAEFLEAWGVLPPDALLAHSLEEEDSDHLMGGMAADKGPEGKFQKEILHEQEVPKEEFQKRDLKVDEAETKEAPVDDKVVQEAQVGVARDEGEAGEKQQEIEEEEGEKEEVLRVKRMRVDEESGDVSAGVGTSVT